MSMYKGLEQTPRTALRRRFLKRSAVWLSLVGCGIVDRAAAVIQPPASDVGAALSALDGREAAPGEVELTLPKVIEDGSAVPVTVATTLPDVEEIFVMADVNPLPIAARFRLGEGVAPRISARIKLAGSGRVYGAVRTPTGLLWTSARAEVAIGGCN
jgi:sulfur-oxidizing protein SoxY